MKIRENGGPASGSRLSWVRFPVSPPFAVAPCSDHDLSPCGPLGKWHARGGLGDGEQHVIASGEAGSCSPESDPVFTQAVDVTAAPETYCEGTAPLG